MWLIFFIGHIWAIYGPCMAIFFNCHIWPMYGPYMSHLSNWPCMGQMFDKGHIWPIKVIGHIRSCVQCNEFRVRPYGPYLAHKSHGPHPLLCALQLKTGSFIWVIHGQWRTWAIQLAVCTAAKIRFVLWAIFGQSKQLAIRPRTFLCELQSIFFVY